MKELIVSVVIPVFNDEKYLENCVNSVLKQTYRNIEIILIDDGSTDDSKKICDRSAKKDKRVRVIHQDNQGASAARNNGLKMCKGDYVVFVDADDEISPRFIEKLLERQKGNNLVVTNIMRNFAKTRKQGLVYSNRILSRKSNEKFKTYVLRLLVKDGKLYPVVNKIFKTEIIKKNQLKFDEKLNFAEDLQFVLSYLSYVDEVSFIKDPLYLYNFGVDNSTVKKTAATWKNWQKSYNYLKKWAGKTALSEKVLLKLIYCRWKISYFKAVRSSKS